MAYNIAPLNELIAQFERLPGIGKKTAQRMIIELKDKMKAENVENTPETTVVRGVVNNDVEEAISALQVLGYNNKDAVDMVNKTYKEGMTIEEIIKLALKMK